VLNTFIGRLQELSKTVVIHQPDFLPYLGFFHRFLQADVWVILDTAQYVSGTSRSWQNRDLIKTPQGERWLTVGVRRQSRTPMRDIMLADSPWREDNLNLLHANYRKAPYFDEIMPFLKELYALPCQRLVEFNLESIRMLMRLLGIEIETVSASELNPAGRSNDLLVDLLRKSGSTRYLSGLGAKGYFEPQPFQDAGIEVVWQEFTHPVYPQLHGEFVPYLSSIDLLFNCGAERSRQIIRSIG
jgi:hypothetical protein